MLSLLELSISDWGGAYRTHEQVSEHIHNPRSQKDLCEWDRELYTKVTSLLPPPDPHWGICGGCLWENPHTASWALY